MKTIIIGEREINIPTEWSDLSLTKYSSIMDLYSKIGELSNAEFVFGFIQLMTDLDKDIIYNFYDEDLEQFSEAISFFNPNNIETNNINHIYIGENLFGVITPNKLTFGEKMSIDILKKNSKTLLDSWLIILSICLRPAKFVEGKLVIEPFDGDIENINKRIAIFKNINCSDAVYILNAFTIGNVL